MRNEVLQFVYGAMVLTIGGALEELLPKALGVGVPVLLAATVHQAVRRPVAQAVLFALAAGAFEDALSALPVMTSPCFFIVVAVLSWWSRRPLTVMTVAYPLCQIWIRAMATGMVGVLAWRLLLAIPMAAATASVVGWVLSRTERKAALDAA